MAAGLVMTERNERQALAAMEHASQWRANVKARRRVERRQHRRDGWIWLLLAALVLLICSAWWVWFT